MGIKKDMEDLAYHFAWEDREGIRDCLATWGVAVVRWRGAENARNPGWIVRAVLSAGLLTAGLAWSFIVVGMYALMRNPWAFNEMLLQVTP